MAFSFASPTQTTESGSPSEEVRPESLANRIRRQRTTRPITIWRFHAILNGIRGFGDLLALAIGQTAGLLFQDFQKHNGIIPWGAEHRVVWICSGILVVLSFAYVGLYSRNRSILNIREYQQLLRGWGIAGAATLLLLFLAKIQIPLADLVSMWVGSLLALFVFRDAFWYFTQFLQRRGFGESTALVYGAGSTGQRLVRKLRQSPQLGVHVVGFVDDVPERLGATIEGLPVLCAFPELRAILRLTGVDRIYIALPQVPRRTVMDIMEVCKARGIDFRVVPSLHDMVLPQVQIQEIDGIPLLAVSSPRITRWNAFWKRVLDIAVSATLLMLLSPLFALVALSIRKVDKGPVFFQQKRVGKDGVLFRMWKFRSMYTHAPKYGITPESGHDPRITPIGRWIRKTSIDELPQLWNVLRGDMSLVGPRPEMPFLVERYDALQRQRLNVLPGMTGLWQISPDRSLAIHENMDYDIYYIHNQSFLLDLAILLQTARVLLFPRAAC